MSDDDDIQQQLSNTVRSLNSDLGGLELVECLEQLVVFAKSLNGKPVADPVPLVKCLRPLLIHSSAYLRTATLRCMRHFVKDHRFIATCWKYKLDWWVARAMDRQKSDREREHAFHLVRVLVDSICDAGRTVVEERELPPQVLQDTRTRSPRAQLSTPEQVSLFLLNNPDLDPSPSLGRGDSMADLASSSSELSLQAAVDLRRTDIPIGIIHRIVSVAETADDPMRKKCILMLRDLAPYRCKVLSQTHGIRALLHAMVEPRLADITPSLLLTFLYILDHHSTRKHMRVNLELQTLFTSFTEKPGKDVKELTERMKSARAVVLVMLRSWTGLICLANEPLALRALIDVLRATGPAYKKNILFELFTQAIVDCAPHRVIPHYLGHFTAEDREEDEPPAKFQMDIESSMGNERARSVSQMSMQMSFSDFPESQAESNDDGRRPMSNICAGYNILDNFLGVLLLLLDQAGLTQTLVDLVQDPVHTAVSLNAAKLLQLIFMLSDTMFPKPACLKLHGTFDRVLSAMVRTARRALDLYKDQTQSVEDLGGAVSLGPVHTHEELGEIQKQNHKVLSMITSLYSALQQQQKQSAHRNLFKGEGLPFQMALLVDDSQLKILLNESHVLATKDFTRWNTERILVLIRGPLRNHQRTLEVMKTKFFKRLLSFLRPPKRLFAEMPYKEENFIWSLLGCKVIELLLLSTEGTKYLDNSQLLSEINTCLEAELGLKGDMPSNHPERVFNKEKIAYSMSREYLRFLGKCSESLNGLGLLQSNNLLNNLYTLTEMARNRDDLCHQILKFINFGRVDTSGLNKYTAPILENAMRHGPKPIRYFATLQLRNCFKAEVQMRDEISDWCVDQLLGQLSDEWKDVAQCAYQILNECCLISEECLDFLIAKKPDIEKLADYAGQVLLLRMLHRPKGFAYLKESGWVEQQMQVWRAENTQHYVHTLETDIQKVLHPLAAQLSSNSNATRNRGRTASLGPGASFRVDVASQPFSSMTCTLPLHMYGELCSTEEGLAYFKQTGAFEEVCNILSQNMTVENDLVGAADLSGDEAGTSEGASDDEEMDYDSDDDWKVDETSHDGIDILTSVEDEHGQGQKEYVKKLIEDADVVKKAPAMPACSWAAGSVRAHRGTRLFTELPQASLPSNPTKQPQEKQVKSIHVRSTLAVRSALWAMGHIGSTELGFQLLLESGRVQKLVDLATYSDCLSLRGTLLCVLGLIARTAAGRAELQRHKWDTHSSCSGYIGQDGFSYSVCLAYPMNLRPLITIPEAKGVRQPLLPTTDMAAKRLHRLTLSGRVRAASVGGSSLPNSNSPGTDSPDVPSSPHSESNTQLNAEIIKAVKSLSNPVLQDQASKELKKIRQKNPGAFGSPKLAAEVYTLMGWYRYRPNARRFLYDFFDGTQFTPEAFESLDAGGF